MDKKLLLIPVIVFVGAILLGTSKKDTTTVLSQKSTTPPADKIEVIHFHATQQCWSCITVGKLALETIQTKFPDEFAQGIITYQDVNVDSPQNQSLVTKYQARGSALFINSIIDGQDNKVEDTTVWRLVGNQSQYVSYFSQRLATLLGK